MTSFDYLISLFGLSSNASESNLPQPTFEVECSCGKKAIVLFREEVGYFVALDEDWKFLFAKGWHCGTAGHEQANYVILSNNHNEVIKEKNDEQNNISGA